MATKKPRPDPGMSRSFFLDDDAFVQEVDRASGWTSNELKQLLSKSEIPDHWNGTPTVALLEAIRYRIEMSPKSYEGCFPTIFKALHLQPTPNNLFMFLRALKKHVTKAKNTGDSLCLTQEIPCLRPSSPSIGLQCTKNGITPLSLVKGSSCKISSSITNAMILEMQDYRAKNHVPWQKVAQVWWKALFKTKIPTPDTIQSSWTSLSKTRQELRREALHDFLRQPYTEPSQEPAAVAESKAKKQPDVHAVDKIPRPQKRRGQALPQNMAITQQYLTANFRGLPQHSSDLKNGHLLFLFSENNQSIPKTIDIVGEKLSCRFNPCQLEALVNRANELRSADYDTVMSKYKSLCCEPVYTAVQGDSTKSPQLSPEPSLGSSNGTKATTRQCSRQHKDTIASMTPTPKTKKVASSLPCEVFFACTRCGSRSRTVPQLHTHYRTVHKEEIANGTLTSKDPGDKSQKEGDTTKLSGKKSTQVDSTSSNMNDRAKMENKERLNPDEQSTNDNRVDTKENSESDVIYVEGSQTPANTARPGPVINHPEKDCVITRKRNVPLGMLEGKKNSLMVIFQHSDQNKPLPEGSSFKLRNTGGEQTYMVVANVDVDIIEQGGPVKKPKMVK